MSNPNIHRMGECATACIAHPLSPLAGVAYMDVGEGREHMYRRYGIRAMHGAIAEDAEALRIAAIALTITAHRALPETK